MELHITLLMLPASPPEEQSLPSEGKFDLAQSWALCPSSAGVHSDTLICIATRHVGSRQIVLLPPALHGRTCCLICRLVDLQHTGLDLTAGFPATPTCHLSTCLWDIPALL